MTPRLDELARYLDGDRPDAPVRVRLATGAAVGAVFCVFVPLLLLMWALGGREVSLRHGILLRVDLLAVLYPLGAIVSGALLFALTALTRTRLLGALLGAVAILPWVAGIVICFDRGYSTWQPLHTMTTASMALIMGGKVGWDRTRSSTGQHKRSQRSAV
jgi:hypothetical protein